jgi:hypothetical protein
MSDKQHSAGFPPWLTSIGRDGMSDEPKNYQGAFWGTVIGILVTPVTFFLAIYSTGAGHGDYGYFGVFYPGLLLLMKRGVIGMGTIAAWGLTQFPAYGAIIGGSGSSGRAAFSAALIFFVHLAAVCLCFWPGG